MQAMTNKNTQNGQEADNSRVRKVIPNSNRRNLLRVIGTGVATATASGVVTGQTDSGSNSVLMAAYSSEKTELDEQKIHALTDAAANRYRKNSGSDKLIPIGIPKADDGQMIASYAVKIFDSGQVRHQASLVSNDASELEIADAHSQTQSFVEQMTDREHPLEKWTNGGN